MKTKLFLLLILSVLLITSCTEKSPYVKGVVTNKQRTPAHFDNQKPIIICEAGFTGGGGRSFSASSSSRSFSSTKSYGSSSGSRSFSVSSRPSYVKSYTPSTSKTTSLAYRSGSGRYYCPVVDSRYSSHYISTYNHSNTMNMLLLYILITNHQHPDAAPMKYLLPEYKLEVQDSATNKEWVLVDSARYFSVHKGDNVYFKRYTVAEYEDEGEY